MPDTPLSNALTDEEIEMRLLAAAVREALEENFFIPHEAIHAEMLERLKEIEAQIASALHD